VSKKIILHVILLFHWSWR